MEKVSLKSRLYRFLKNNPQWIAKGKLCDLAREAMKATGEHTGRRLRELHEAGLIEVEYRDKHHAWYKIKETEPYNLKLI